MAQGLLRVAGQTALGQKVGQTCQAHRDVARGLRRLGVGRQQTFADLEAALVMAQGLLRVAGQTATGPESRPDRSKLTETSRAACADSGLAASRRSRTSRLRW
jgi:hypothetical protein